MALTASDQPNHQTQQSGKPVCVLAGFCLIYAVPDFPQSDAVVLCVEPRGPKSPWSDYRPSEIATIDGLAESRLPGEHLHLPGAVKHVKRQAANAFTSARLKRQKKGLKD